MVSSRVQGDKVGGIFIVLMIMSPDSFNGSDNSIPQRRGLFLDTNHVWATCITCLIHSQCSLINSGKFLSWDILILHTPRIGTISGIRNTALD